jgi:hypothetical protein
MGEVDESLPTDPKRVRAFATFFKNYMSVSSLVVAALPIPATALGALPTFSDYKASLSTYTSLFCFLTLGFIFYMRHSLARWMFPSTSAVPKSRGDSAPEASQLTPEEKARADELEEERRYAEEVTQLRLARRSNNRSFVIGILPLALLLSSGCLVFLYHYYLDVAVLEIARALAHPRSATGPTCAGLDAIVLDVVCSTPTRDEILKQSYLAVPRGATLMALYICMFVTAEAAFILMATREYVQDLLRLTDWEVIRGGKAVSGRQSSLQPQGHPAKQIGSTSLGPIGAE